MRKSSLIVVSTLVVLIGVVASAAVLIGPARPDRSVATPVLSTRVMDFGTVPVNTDDAEMLLTVRNTGGAVASVNTSMVLRQWTAVCPPGLDVHVRMSECGFTQPGATDPACAALQAGASCALAIDFKPRVPHRYTARYCVELVTAHASRRAESCLELRGRATREGFNS
jgi:hypothetical protein